MKTYNLNIKRSDVFDSVSAITHYTGFKDTSDVSSFERIATIDDNDEILSKFWSKSVNQLVGILSPFISNIEYTKTETSYPVVTQSIDNLAGNIGNIGSLPTITTYSGLFATLNMSDMWDSKLLSACTSAATNFLLAGLLEQWYRITNPNAVSMQVADANSAATELRILLYSRTRPSFTSDFYSDGDTESSESASNSDSSESTVSDTSGSSDDTSGTTAETPSGSGVSQELNQGGFQTVQ